MASKLKIKLLKYNLSRPVENRISFSEVESREKIARVRGNNAALLASIHEEIRPKLEAMREAEDFIQNRRGEFQGYVTNHADGHYNGHVYSMGKETEPNLAFENSPEFALVIHSQKMKEEQTKERVNENI